MSAERYFCNKFSDKDDTIIKVNEKFGISEALSSRIGTFMQQKLIILNESLDSSDHSVYTGLSGIALFYINLALKEEASCQLRRDYLARAHAALGPAIASLKGKRVTLLCGDGGPLAVGAVLYHYLGDKQASQMLISKLIQMKPVVVNLQSDLPDEYLYGRAGYLGALALVRKHVPDSQSVITPVLIDEVCQALIASGRKGSSHHRSRSPLMYDWHGKKYLGAAHGLAGILYVLLQCSSESPGVQQILHTDLKAAIDYLLELVYPSGNFPSSEESSSSDLLLHWCHGAPGVIYTLAAAYQIYKDPKYLTAALKCGDTIWERGLLTKGYGLCHGTAGNGYAHLLLYRLTEDRVHLKRAAMFASWCVDYGKHGCRTADRPYSLFEGLAGTLNFLRDIQDNPDSARFPAYELW